MMNCAVLLRAFSLPNQSKAFRRNTVFFLLPPFSTRRAKMVGFPYTHKSRGFERKHGAAAYRWEELTKAPVSPSMLLNPRRYGDGAKDLFITLNCVQENIIRGGQRDRYRRRPDGRRMPKSRAIKGVDEDMKLNKAPSGSRVFELRLKAASGGTELSGDS